MIPDAAALMERIKTEGAFNVLAEILADTSDMVLAFDEKMVGMPEGPAKIATSNAFSDGEALIDGLTDAMTLLRSDGVVGALVHLVLANEMLDQANSWADEVEPTERWKVRLEQTLEAAIRSLNFALPALLALPEAQLARRIAKRCVAHGILDEAKTAA